MKPTRPINATGNPDWRYVGSGKTNVGATIRREQKRIADAKAKDAAEQSARNLAEASSKVRKIGRAK